MKKHRIIFSGSGGQGVITASVILAEAAALYEGLEAVQVQAYGPEARGGATRGDVIISDTDIYFPMVIQPEALVSLTQTAYDKFLGNIQPGGLLLTDSHFVTLNKKVDAYQTALSMYKTVMDKIGKPIVFNICMLGAITGLTHFVKPESIIKALETRFPAEIMDINKKALEIGLELAEGHGIS
ncbi:MAG: 2-oxoacid:acceptor oxidoreductase family protein [Deltaproteobacteria bacterium]|nr:2-oxoacid:acceptor oxidoreductase family protein [Deltaproteobacteria bacterium]